MGLLLEFRVFVVHVPFVFEGGKMGGRRVCNLFRMNVLCPVFITGLPITPKSTLFTPSIAIYPRLTSPQSRPNPKTPPILAPPCITAHQSLYNTCSYNKINLRSENVAVVGPVRVECTGTAGEFVPYRFDASRICGQREQRYWAEAASAAIREVRHRMAFVG